MEVLVLASGSSGNAAVVRGGGVSLLLDAGLSTLQLRRRLEALGGSLDELAAVLVSHEHVDHKRALDVFCRHHGAAVWATSGTWTYLPRVPSGGELTSGRAVRFGGLTVTPVATSHDAREPVAFLVDDGVTRLALCTDTGIVTPLLAERLAGCDLLLLETNHDADMLRHGPYPWPLKQRIASRHGHLGNHQAQDALDRLRHPGLKAVVGMHLSEENNAPDLARACLTEVVGPDLAVDTAGRWEMLRLVTANGSVELTRHAAPSPSRRRRV